MKRCLICLTKPHGKCVDCNKTFCIECTYPTSTLSRICIKCFKKKKLHIIPKREGMTFKQLCYKAREIVPQGYAAVQVQYDNFTGGAEPKLTFVVYHENYGHCSGPTPEEALKVLQVKIREKENPEPVLEDINI